MGIRFLCPNGHKLNVKSFLAGKKGVCPQCGARFAIPTESDPQAGRKKRKDNDPEGGAQPAGSPAAVKPAPSAAPAPVASIGFTLPATPLVAPLGTAVVPAATIPTVATVTPNPVTAVALPASPAVHVAVSTPPAAAPAPHVTDPIAEAPHAVWYVRPPTGNQYGPARGDIMRKWIAEGRVSADSLVWREGWTDWQAASQVLPSMTASAVTAPAVASPVVFGGTAPTVAEVRFSDTAAHPASRPRSRARARPSTSLAIGIVVTLALLAVGLLVALVIVIQHSAK